MDIREDLKIFVLERLEILINDSIDEFSPIDADYAEKDYVLYMILDIIRSELR